LRLYCHRENSERGGSGFGVSDEKVNWERREGGGERVIAWFWRE